MSKKIFKSKKLLAFSGLISIFGIGFIACKLSVPTSIELEVPDSHYEFPLGRLKTSKYFKPENFLENLEISGSEEDLSDKEKESQNKINIYDYNEEGKSKDMVFLMEYNLADVSLDFIDYVRELDFEAKLSEGLNKEFKIEKPDMSFSSSNDLDLNGQILSVMGQNISLVSFPINEPGAGTTVETDIGDEGLSEISLDFTSPEFANATFRNGNLALKFKKIDNIEITPGFSFNAKVGLYDTEDNLITHSGDVLVDCTNGGTVLLPLDNKKIKPNLKIKIYGILSEGTFKVEHQYSIDVEFEEANFKEIIGITMTSDELGAAGTTPLDMTISLADSLGEFFVSSTIDEGLLTIKAEEPSDWTGVECDISDLNIAGGFNIPYEDLYAGETAIGENFFVNRECRLNGKPFLPLDVAITGTLKLSLNNACLYFPEDGPIPLKIDGNCDIKKFAETKINFKNLIGDSTLSSPVEMEMPSNASAFLKSVSFAKIYLDGDFTESKMPPSDLKIKSSLTSTSFGLSDPLTSSTSIDEKLTMEKIFEPPHKYAMDRDNPESNTIDSIMEMQLSGADEANPDHITFANFVLGEEYSLKMSLLLDFDIAELVMYTDGTGMEDSISTTLNVRDLFASALGSTLTQEQMDRIAFHPDTGNNDGTLVYLYVSKPSTGDVEDPLKAFPMSGKIFASDGDLAEGGEILKYKNPRDKRGQTIYLLGSDTGTDEIAFKDPIYLEKHIVNKENDDGSIHKCINTKRDELFKEGSYSTKVPQFADILNANPENLFINYHLALGTNDGVGEVTITGEQFKAMKNVEGNAKTSLQIKMIVYLPMSLDVVTDENGNGFEIPDMFALGGNILVGDFLGRENADSMEDVKKYIDIIDTVGISYQSNYIMNTKMLFALIDEKENPVVKVDLTLDSLQQKRTGLNNSAIHAMFDTYPLSSKMSFEIGNNEPPGTITTFHVPRDLELTLFADIQLKKGERITVWEK